MCCLDLSLGWRNFLDHNLGHGVSSRISISSFLSHAAPNVDSHSNNSLGNSSVVSFTVQLCECWYRFFRGLKKYPSRHQQGRDGSLRGLRDSCARGTFLGVEAERENPACHISYEFWIPPTFVTLVRLEPFDYPIRKSGVIFAYRVARNFCGSFTFADWSFLCFAGTNFCDYTLIKFSFLLSTCNRNPYFQTVLRCAYPM